MKKIFIVPVILLSLLCCKKEKNVAPAQEETPIPTPAAPSPTYSSLSDFYLNNTVAMQSYTMGAASGGSFVTAKGTTVNVPANAFNAVGTTVKIEFKDIYSKSDMLLSNVATNRLNWFPTRANGPAIKSAGEFFIRGSVDNIPAALNPTMNIEILQPFLALPDTGMKPFTGVLDTLNNEGWANDWNNNVSVAASNYIFSLYQFASPVTAGTWCNSDNSAFFSAYTQATLNLHPTQNDISPNVFLVFKNVSSMVHVYLENYQQGPNFVYEYAPIGLECTVVAIGVKDGKLYSSFTPITIGANQTMNFTLVETTTDAFKTALNDLN
jgi:hypothetical protein